MALVWLLAECGLFKLKSKISTVKEQSVNSYRSVHRHVTGRGAIRG